MSTPALLFSVYFFIGLLLMVIATATRGKEKRAKYLDISQASPVDAGLMIFIAVLLRWTPKVGQDGSLTQSQKNDPYVEETSSAQS
jgi:hypothetical protein